MRDGDPLEATANYDAAADEWPTDGAPAAAEMASAHLPEHIGRYRIERVLGKGGFGLVYLAHDDQLSRPVAIKVPHRELVDRLEDAEAYLTEARTVANLDHPHIVPVFDVGSTEQFPCFVVSKFIDGTDLATRLKQSRLSIHETVELVATVAEALHHAHKQGLVHRDIKPGNILLDKSGKPFVADFGLALREQDVGKGPRYAGTPAYMSPEQARGEGHRVDGRATSSAWAWSSTNCSWGDGRFGRTRRRNCWNRSRASSLARPASSTTTSRKNWSASVSKRCRSGPRSATRRQRTWPTICGIFWSSRP